MVLSPISIVDFSCRRTRTSTPVPKTVVEDDVTMSSGDESDDADLTDGDSFGDDWSDDESKAFSQLAAHLLNLVIASSGRPGLTSLMSFYSPIMRHYASNRSNRYITWDNPPFVLTRVREVH